MHWIIWIHKAESNLSWFTFPFSFIFIIILQINLNRLFLCFIIVRLLILINFILRLNNTVIEINTPLSWSLWNFKFWWSVLKFRYWHLKKIANYEKIQYKLSYRTSLVSFPNYIKPFQKLTKQRAYYRSKDQATC